MNNIELSQDWPCEYQFILKGFIQGKWDDYLTDIKAIQQDQHTIISGKLSDPSALFGLLGYFRDLGINLLSVTNLSEQFSKKGGNHEKLAD
jgi:hypothetical protein